MKGDGVGNDIIALWRRLRSELRVSVGVRAGGGGLMMQGASERAIGWMHVMSAGLWLSLRLRLSHSHHGGAEGVHHGRLAGPGGGMGNVGRGSRGGARAAGVKGRGAAMETDPAVSTAAYAAAAQVHGQGLLLVVVVGCVATAADSSAGGGQGGGPLHGAAGLLKGHGAWRLRCRVMDVVQEVVSAAVAVLGAAGLLRGRRLQAARVGVAEGKVAGRRASTRGVLLAAGGESGHRRTRVFSCCTRQRWGAFILRGCAAAGPLCVHTFRY